MTTAVPLIYSFPEFSGVAEAVADLIVTAQNKALSKSHDENSNTNTTNNSSSVSSLSNNNNLINSNINSSQINNSSPNIITNNINSIQQRNTSQLDSSIQDSNNNNIHSNLMSTSPSTGSQIRKKKKENNKRFKIGISGGSLLNVLNEGLLKRNDIKWDKWDIYFADERLVPFDSLESNYGQAKSKLFDKIPIENGKPNIFPINKNLLNDPQECADDYEKTLIQGFASKDSVKLPLFDLILLGCAPDGHVASLFPNHETLREQYAWCVPVENSPVGPLNRISLSVPVICHSHMVAFVVEGSTKAPVLSTIMERPDKGLPASIINEKAAGKIAWFVDDDAISDVVGITKKRYKFTA
ncbi:suppressor of los1-1 [Pichia californica]|uniref:Suppressor of los1-1 n=1 Tax=Pichia californica TaxID=460514 RepID=A0A9P7BDQ8_9ASCO|nr:suppressor of los1-1 [[Candida] californica]